MRYLFGILLLVGCGTPEVTSGDVADLVLQKAALDRESRALQTQTDEAAAQLATTEARVKALQQDEAVLAAMKAGRGVHYVLHVRLKQTHYSLNLLKHAADAANAEEFDIITDKASYDSAQEGTELLDAFRVGSAVLHGSLGSWSIRVLSKRTITEGA